MDLKAIWVSNLHAGAYCFLVSGAESPSLLVKYAKVHILNYMYRDQKCM